MKINRICVLVVMAVAGAVVAGCGKKSETPGGTTTDAALDKAAAQTTEAVKTTAETAKDAAGQVVQKTGEVLEKAGAAVEKAGAGMQK